jgi:hypothetical protein
MRLFVLSSILIHSRNLVTKSCELISLTALVVFSSSCVTKIPSSFLKDPFGNIVKAIESHHDPETVRQGFPSFLLLLDSLVTSSPENRNYLYAATSAYNSYCQAFFLDEAESERGNRLFEHARGYGIRLLEKNKFIDNADNASLLEMEEALQKCRKKDVPHLYAVASVWLGWILTNTDSMDAMSELPKALSLMHRVYELDESYSDGSVHLFYGIFYAVQPRGAGRNLKKSYAHFTRAMELAGKGNLLPSVAYAEYYAVTTLDEDLFTNTLAAVLKEDIGVRAEIRFMNELAVRRAEYLLENRDDLF